MPRISAGNGGGGSGRSPSARGHTIGVHAPAIGAPTSMPSRSTDGCQHRVAARAAVGEVDDRVHGAVFGGGVRLRHVDGQAVVERDAAARHFDEHRLDARDLGRVEQRRRVFGLEDVHELADADRVRTGEVAHRAVGERRAVAAGSTRSRCRVHESASSRGLGARRWRVRPLPCRAPGRAITGSRRCRAARPRPARRADGT